MHLYLTMKINPVRFFLYLLTALIICGTVKHSPLAAETGKTPRLVFEEDSHNFGDIYKGEKVSHWFAFTNAGTGDLVINSVKTSCGCTAAAPSQKSIPPGTGAEIEVTFKSDVFRGSIRKTVTVDTNDPEKPRYALTIEANVLEEVVAEPPTLWFNQIKLGQSVAKEVDIKSLTDLKLKITKVRSSSPVLEFRVRKKDGDGSPVLEVSTRKGASLGRFAGDVQVFTNSKRQPLLTIPFFGEIVSDVSVFPPKISYGVVRKGEEVTRQVLITIHTNDIKLEKFDLKPDFLGLHHVPDSNNYFHRLDIILGKDVPAGRLEGSLTIHTTSKDQPLLTVPIYGVIKEG